MRRIASAKVLLPVLLSALLAGCAMLPADLNIRAPRDGFGLVGRVAVRQGSDGASGRIEWRHGPSADDLLITSPLGQGIAQITRRGGEYRLVMADRTEYTATDAEALTEQVLGWRLPLAGLPDWVQGRADPVRPARLTLDSQWRLSELTQDEWKIEYQEYEGARPSKLRLSRAGLEIRLVVDQWLTAQ